MRAGLTIIAMVVLVMLTIRWSFIGVLVVLLSSILRYTIWVETYGTFHIYHGVEVFYVATILSVILAHPEQLATFVPRGLMDWGMLGFLLAMAVSAALNGVAVLGHKYIDLFFKATVLYFLITRLVTTRRQLTTLVVALIASTTYLVYLAWSKYRAGMMYYARPYYIVSFHDFGLQMVLTVPFIGALAARKRLWIPFRAVLLMLIPFYLLVTLRTHSRSAMLGMFFALALLTWHLRKRWYLMLPLVPLMAFAVAHNPDVVMTRLTSIWTHETASGVDDPSIRSRFEQMRTAKNIIKGNPLFGIGPRQFFYKYEQFQETDDKMYYTREVKYTMHSVPLLILCEEGLVGGLAYLLLVIGGLRSAIYVVKHTRGDPELSTVAAVGAGSFMSFMAFLAYSLAQPQMWMVHIYATMALVVTSRMIVERHLAERAAEQEAPAAQPVPWLPPAAETEIVFS